MKKFHFSFLFLICLLNNALSQTNVELRIYHKLGANQFQLNAVAQNNDVQDFKVTRIEYYITRISVIHDGGNVLAITDDTVALINANAGVYSTIKLGALNVNSIEGVRFYIGVYEPVNNADPSIYPSGHPLAPKSPSMHWGWASGYRFLVYEGKGGANFSQTFQFHALGNANYMEVDVPATAQMISNTLIVPIDADYVKGVESVDVASGILAHGVDQEDLAVLNNFKNLVFTGSNANLGVENLQSDINFNFYPNPTTDFIKVESNSQFDDLSAQVIDLNGNIISETDLSKTNVLNLESTGMYFVKLFSKNVQLGTYKISKVK